MGLFPHALMMLNLLVSARAPIDDIAVRRWGPLGHRIVADVAQARLTPVALAATRRLLAGQTIADVASWADEHRSEMPYASPWHYVDIEIGDTGYVPARDCKQDACVIAAVEHQIRILADTSQPDSSRATALKWVVHLIGDLHQPLHGGEHADKGGNDVRLMFHNQNTNLHSLWDSGLLLSYGQTETDIVSQLLDEISRRNDIDQLTRGGVVSWVMESHDIARDFVYPKLPASNQIPDSYAESARPIVRERLLRAGVRLAFVLNDALRHG